MGICESIEDDSEDNGSPNLKDDLDSSFYSGPITPPATRAPVGNQLWSQISQDLSCLFKSIHLP